MKRITVIFVTLCMLLTLFVPFAIANGEETDTIEMYVDSGKAFVNGTEYYIDKDNKAVTPIVENARTLVPARFIAESLKMNVSWDENSQLVTIENGSTVVKFTIGSNEMIVNDEKIPIDSENDKIIAKTENDRTLIPVRALLEAIGKKVFYDRGLIVISDNENIYNAETDKTILDEKISKLNVLPTVGTAENLEKLIGNVDDGIRYFSGGGGTGVIPMASAIEKSAAAPTNAKSDYSQTNTQVSGVDEADLVKTDGEYIYQVNGQRIVIAKINPAQEMSVTSIISRPKEQFNPIDMFVDGNKLVVFANIVKNYDEPQIIDSATTKMIRRPDYYNNNLLECAVYDITDKKTPKLERTLDIEGGYISSRKIGDVVYIVASKNIYYYYGGVQPMVKSALTYTDSATVTPVDVGFDKVSYFPNFEERNYLVVASINITKPDEKANVETMLGGGQNIYASNQNLFVATGKYKNEDNTFNTLIYKFSLNNGEITYLSKGEVAGNIINQFSMDENKGSFRIATTVNGNQQYNNLYILDDTMKPRGKIENIAPGEKIYSTRFVGDRGYMVTFKQIDPLFVMDLSDIDNPKILGKLKIPGYSDYLHPIDENHILGFGKDTILQQQYDEKGNPIGDPRALYQGMKMSLFDVTDVANPIQEFVEVIGDRGTDSPLLQNHKALLYSAEKKLLAFPVTVRKVQGDTTTGQYGEFTFNGAYVYNFDIETGFKLKGKISHLTEEDMLKAGDYPDYTKTIDRILFAGDNLITTSQAKIEAHSIANVKFINSIDIK